MVTPAAFEQMLYLKTQQKREKGIDPNPSTSEQGGHSRLLCSEKKEETNEKLMSNKTVKSN
jgi:hypothetical protein